MGGPSPAALLLRPPRPSRPLVLLLVLLLLPNSPASSSPFTGPARGPIYTLKVSTAAGVKPLYVLRGQHPVLVGRRFCRRHDSYRECRQILAALCGALPCAGPAYTLRLANQGARTPLTVYAGEEASDAVHYFVRSESLPGETAAQLQQHLCAAGIEGVSCAHAAPAKVLFFLVLAHHHSGSPNDGHAYELDFTDRDKATGKEGATGNNPVLNGAAVRVAAEFCGTHGWLGEQCSVRDIAEELTRRSELGDEAERARREGRRFAVGASPWDVLGLDEGADDGGGEGLSKSVIRKAYRRQSLQWHPDKCGAGRGGGGGGGGGGIVRTDLSAQLQDARKELKQRGLYPDFQGPEIDVTQGRPVTVKVEGGRPPSAPGSGGGSSSRGRAHLLHKVRGLCVVGGNGAMGKRLLFD